jgi:hypothetical protein
MILNIAPHITSQFPFPLTSEEHFSAIYVPNQQIPFKFALLSTYIINPLSIWQLDIIQWNK